MNTARQARLRRINKAQIALEERLLALQAMFDPHSDKGPHDPWKHANDAFSSLYYLVRLAKDAE